MIKMSWSDILNKFGYNWVLEDLWYRMFSNNASAYSIKKYLQRNIGLTKVETALGNIPIFRANSRDKLVLDVFDWVTKNIQYKHDIDSFKLMEKWEDIDIILELKTGDCESMSVLLYSILRHYKINPLQLRYVYGGVKKYGDHVYIEYQADETMEWYILDPAYAPNNKTAFKHRKTLDETTGYLEKKTYISDFELK